MEDFKMTDQPPTSKELEALFVEDGEQAIDSLLRATLEPLIGFTRDGRLVSKASFLSMPDTMKILAVLLARLAMSRLHLPGAQPEASAEKLANDCAVPLKSCREHLSRFKARRLLEKNDSGYFVPTWEVSDIAGMFRGKA
jgi:hypothetical protein